MKRTQQFSITNACTDGGCIYGHPGGMHTNGGCDCADVRGAAGRVKFRKVVMQLREALRALDAADAFGKAEGSGS